MGTVIEVNNLVKHYGNVKAVDGISFEIEDNSLFGFLGINGAGKSTTINMLCTLLKPTSGTIRISGLEVGKNDREIRNYIGCVRQGNCLDDLLSVRENLSNRGSLFGMSRAEINGRIGELCDELGMQEIISRRYAKLSGGQKRKAEIAAALMNNPKILFLDEPTTGLDPASRRNVWECINSIRKKTGMTVFLTTHYMEEAAPADKIAIIDSGKILECGTPAYLKGKYARDTLRLYAKPGHEAEIDKLGSEIKLQNSMEAMPILKQYEDSISGFEVIQGTMDDVFLNVSGKECEKA